MSGEQQGALFVPVRHAGMTLGFEAVPIARSTDPSTSHEAADLVTASGRRNRDAAHILAVVQAEPGLTYREIHQRIRSQIAEPATIAKRLADLERTGAVAKGPRRTCRVGGNPCATWEPRP